MLHRCLPLLQLQRNPAPPCDKTLITDATSFFHTLWKITRVMTQRSGLNLICSRQQDKKKQKNRGHILLLSASLLCHSVCASATYVVQFLFCLFFGLERAFWTLLKQNLRSFYFIFLKKIYRINTFCVLCHQKYEVWLKVYKMTVCLILVSTSGYFLQNDLLLD